MNSNERLEADVSAIRTDLRQLRVDAKQMEARVTKMWLSFVERKAMWQVLRFVLGGVLVGLTIVSFVLAIVQNPH